MHPAKARSCGLKCAALRFPAVNPLEAFESPNPRRNVYRSVSGTTPLTLNTAAIGSPACQEAQKKTETRHFSCSPKFTRHVCFLENHQNHKKMFCFSEEMWDVHTNSSISAACFRPLEAVNHKDVCFFSLAGEEV